MVSTVLGEQFARPVTVLVIGGGQAGLSAGFHLQHRGFANVFSNPTAELSYAILDAGEAPGGAWRFRWSSLTMETVNGIFDLPRFEQGDIAPDTPAVTAVPAYFADFEREMDLAIKRPVHVFSVTEDEGSDGFIVHTSAGIWLARGIINATGTWTNPIYPAMAGQDSFRGRQIHTHDYISHHEFSGQRVAIVGGGISAIEHLEEISRVAQTFWFTRREPVFREGDFSPEHGREVVAKVAADAEAGRPTGSVVSYTGLGWGPYARAARDRGVLNRLPLFREITPTGVISAEGEEIALDAIVWATGFKPAISHLDPLGLRNEAGAIQITGTQVTADPRIHLIGYGPSQSTVGANRAGNIAVRKLHRFLTAS